MFRNPFARLRLSLARVLRHAGFVTRGQLRDLHVELAEFATRIDLLHQKLALIQTELAALAGAAARKSDLASLGSCYQIESNRVSGLLQWLAKEPWRAEQSTDGPLVSVVLPIRDRRDLLPVAIASVQNQTYSNWEVLVVDDGGPPIKATGDSRIRYLKNRGRGVSAARNTGLDSARGQFVAYLDSDNTMAPGYLAGAVAALQRHPETPAVYAAQVIAGPDGRLEAIRFPEYCPSAMARGNQIDINVFVHRRAALSAAFDESLERLVDWDMIRNVLRSGPPVPVPALGGTYSAGESGRITTDIPLGPSFTKVRRKWEKTINGSLRVLYALWHWPQLTESYVRWEIDYMRRRGIEVMIWTATESVAAWFEHQAPVRRGSFDAAVSEFRPDIVHGHWLHFVEQYAGHCQDRALPLTVRGHGFEFHPDIVKRLQEATAVRSIYLFPHQSLLLEKPDKIIALGSGFSTDLFYPEPKDRRRVVRAAAAIPTKDLTTFMDVAQRCPEFQFTLITAPVVGNEQYLDHLMRENRERGRPVEMRVSLSHEETARLVRVAGICLHTHAPEVTVGEPVSISEAMGTGCYVLTRDLEPLGRLIGNAGQCYASAEDAARLLRETLRWSDVEWRAAGNRSLDRAHLNHADHVVFEQLLNDWQQIALSAGRSRLAA
ncbi:MAG: glycosyltransferase [Gemmataceae bacterium]|nr:glycosyltransferase [Gemmataceae bacterium]